MNRVEVLERLQPIRDTEVRRVDAQPKTRVVVTPDQITLRPGSGQRHLEFDEEGARSMAKHIGLPWNVAMNLAPGTFGDAATELLQKKGRFSILVREGTITAVTKPSDYQGVNAERALKAIEAGIHGAEYRRVLMHENGVVALEIVGEKREPVKRGDLIRAGAHITFSPLGTIDPTVQGYAERCICTNGMTSNSVLRVFKYSGGGSGRGGGGEGDDIWQWFQKASREAYNSLTTIVARYKAMMDERIPAGDRASMLESMLKEAGITGEEAQVIRAMALESPPQNSYQMMNLLTNATSHLLEEPRTIRRAQKAIAEFAGEDTHARICPVCKTARKGKSKDKETPAVEAS